MNPKNNLFYQEFMSAMQKKISHKATLANTITDLLVIDKDAVYRRLRGEVDFSFAEMAIIARSLGISLDSIAGIENLQIKPSRLNISRQVDPTAIDYEMFDRHIDLLKSITDESDAKLMEAGNTLSYYLYNDYEYLARFHQFRWNQASSFANSLPYHEITIPKRMRDLQHEVCNYARRFKSSSFTLDQLIFQRLVANIKYFARMRLIKEEDVSLIKKDLIAFVDYLEKLAIKGKYEETGNEVSLFISNFSFDANYCCMKSKNMHISIFRVYILNTVMSFDAEAYNETYAWIQARHRMSTLISVCGEKIRAEFFDTQRKIIDTL